MNSSRGADLKQLTVKEALEQGYTHFGYDNGDFQRLNQLDKVTPEDFEPNEWRGGVPVLADKEPYYLSISGDAIRDIISDHICEQDDFRDDDPSIVEDALKEVEGWYAIAEMVNKKLKEHPYWYLTEIKLIP